MIFSTSTKRRMYQILCIHFWLSKCLFLNIKKIIDLQNLIKSIYLFWQKHSFVQMFIQGVSLNPQLQFLIRKPLLKNKVLQSFKLACSCQLVSLKISLTCWQLLSVCKLNILLLYLFSEKHGNKTQYLLTLFDQTFFQNYF